MNSLFFKYYINKLYPKVWEYYKLLKKQEKLSPDEIQNIQLIKLNEIIKYSRRHCKFYRDLWNLHGVPLTLSSLDDFNSFPTVSKQMLSEALKNQEIIPSYFIKNKLYYTQTTGSTGLPFRYPLDSESSARRLAVELRSFDWYGYQFGISKRARLWRGNLNASFKDVIRQYVYNQMAICIYDPMRPVDSQLNEKRAIEIVKDLNRFKPSNIDGFVSALTFLAKYIDDNDIKLSFNLESVTTGAEYLSQSSRQLIQKAFNVPVYNRYGGTESGLIAHETRGQAFSNNNLYLASDSIYTELYSSGIPIKNGEGAVVFTDFSCLSMPFVKYINGDIAKFSNYSNTENVLPFRSFVDVKGRVNDFFLLPNGNYLSSHIWHNYFRQANFISQFQVIQEDVRLVIVNYVLNKNGGNCNNELVQLKNRVQDALPGCEVVWVETQDINCNTGGKFRHSISKLKIDINEYN